MSIIPYNNENFSVVLRSPEAGSIVLYNKQTNSLELLSLRSSQSPTPDAVPEFPGGEEVRKLTSGDVPPDEASGTEANSGTFCPRCGCNIRSENHESRRSSGSSRPFVSSDYFRLLAKADEFGDSGKMILRRKRLIGNGDSSSADDELGDFPASLFTQGYFAKFFRVKQKLGSGSNGVVLKVEHILNGFPLGTFALKKIPVGSHLANLSERLNEVKLLFQLTESSEELVDLDGKESLIKYNHVWLEIDQISDFTPRVPCVFILFEYCDGGNLEELVESLKHPVRNIEKEKQLRRERRLSGEKGRHFSQQPRLLNNLEIYKIFRDIVAGVAYLHRSHILHRDLKPSNCLLRQEFSERLRMRSISSVAELNSLPSITVSDFGEGIMEGTKRNSTGATGTVEFCAPELFEETPTGGLVDFTTGSDVYSLGMVLYYLCFGVLPYDSSNPESVKAKILECYRSGVSVFELRERSLGEPLIEEWNHLMRGMLDPNNNNRPSCEEVLNELNAIYVRLSQEPHIPPPPPPRPLLTSSQKELNPHFVALGMVLANILMYRYICNVSAELLEQSTLGDITITSGDAVVQNFEGFGPSSKNETLVILKHLIFLAVGLELTSSTRTKVVVFAIELCVLIAFELT